MQAGLNKGQLTTWKDDRGFGFIQPANGSQEVFLHISELKDSTRRPKVGDIIYYYPVAEEGKTRAVKAFILGARMKSDPSASSNQAKAYVIPVSLFPWLEVAVLATLPLLGTLHCVFKAANFLPLIIYPVMSVYTFSLYADDKVKAKRKRWRTSEKTLHLCELAGGWLGGFAAQRMLHHKNSKRSYQFEFWTIVILHQIGWLYWLILHLIMG